MGPSEHCLLIGREQPDCLRQAQPDDPADLVAVRQRQAGSGKGRFHSGDYPGLAIDQRAVAVEHGEPRCHGARVRIS